MISFSVKLRTCKVFYNFSLIIRLSDQLICFESVLIMRIHDVCKEIYGDYLKICCRIIGDMKYPCVSLWNGADTIMSWNDHIQCIENTQNKRCLGFFKYGNGCYEQYWPNTTTGHQPIRQQWAEFNLATDTKIDFILLIFCVITSLVSLTIARKL